MSYDELVKNIIETQQIKFEVNAIKTNIDDLVNVWHHIYFISYPHFHLYICFSHSMKLYFFFYHVLMSFCQMIFLGTPEHVVVSTCRSVGERIKGLKGDLKDISRKARFFIIAIKEALSVRSGSTQEVTYPHPVPLLFPSLPSPSLPFPSFSSPFLPFPPLSSPFLSFPLLSSIS